MTGTKMRPIARTIPLVEAQALIDAAIRPIERTERVALASANGRVLALNIVAATDVPPFSRAGMDGYAVRAEDTIGSTRTSPSRLRKIATSFTGEASTLTVSAGECVEIATGAPMPTGADAVVMVEETFREGDTVSVFAVVNERQNVGRQGADITRGATVLTAGDVLNPSRIGAMAALGLGDVTVFARPRVAIASTGNEVVGPGTPLAAGQIYDINRFTLEALVSEHGGVAIAHPPVADTLDALTSSVDQALAEDMVVFSGGSSVGERDLLIDVIQARGKVIFHGIAIKPGKPTAFGMIADKPFFGLPGYPTSCLSNGYILLAPALRRMARLPQALVRRVTGPLGRRVISTMGRHQFYSVRIVDGVVMPAFKASGDITSMSQAEGYIEIPADVEAVEEGSIVEVTLF